MTREHVEIEITRLRRMIEQLDIKSPRTQHISDLCPTDEDEVLQQCLVLLNRATIQLSQGNRTEAAQFVGMVKGILWRMGIETYSTFLTQSL